MAIKRQQNFLGQMRVDVPHLRSIESAVANDFDVLAGGVINGKESYVIKGFEFSSWIAGQAADSLILNTASSSLIHPNASESGSVFTVPESQDPETLETTNSNVSGSFTPNSTNYVGIDLVRSADSSTSDLVQFNNPDTDQETGIYVPLARTINYVIVISTSDFSTNLTVCPLHIVTTDSSNNVLDIVDARPLLFRLGSGGSSPDSGSVWGWPGGRNEVVSSIAGDFSIGCFKDWMNAIMTRLFELGGGEEWYSNTADRNVQVLYNAVFTNTGEPYDTTSSGHVLWKGVSFIFDNSTGHVNQVADQITTSTGLTNLTADGDCIYVDLDRTQERTVALNNALVAQKGNLKTLGTSSPPGSRYVLVAKIGSYYYTRGQYLPIGSAFRVATTTILGIVKLSATPYTPLAPVVVSITDSDYLAGCSGISRYGTNTTGNITIGGQTGDWSVLLATTGNGYTVQVTGTQLYKAGSGLPVFQVTALTSGNYDCHLADFKFGAEVSAAYIDAQGAIGQSNTHYLPNNDLFPATSGGGAVKYLRPSKYWKTAVDFAYHGTSLTYVTSAHNSQKRLTASANGILYPDGATGATTNQRILFCNDNADDGVYIVTVAGDSGTKWVLDRASDFLTTTYVSQGFAVSVTSGDTYAGQYFVLDTADPITLETTVQHWALTDSYTCDQTCIKWGDGTVTVIAESAPYAGVS